MSETKSKPSAGIPSWALVAGAAALVLGLSIAEQRRTSGAPAPQISLPLLDGPGNKGVEAGKVTLIDFWATWCAPCRVSMPKVQKLWSDYTPRGLELLSVDTDDASPDREPNVKEFLLKNGLTFPVVLDDGSGHAAYGANLLPTMVLVGKDGKVLWRHVGLLAGTNEIELRALLDQALAQR